jgi:hypothetical protein
MWVNLSSAQGNAAAKRAKDVIVKEMTKDQIAEGQRLSREWLMEKEKPR